MKMLSLGIPSTLGNWLELTRATFGPESAAAKFFEQKIETSKNGVEEEVIADEGQLLFFLANLEGKSNS